MNFIQLIWCVFLWQLRQALARRSHIIEKPSPPGELHLNHLGPSGSEGGQAAIYNNTYKGFHVLLSTFLFYGFSYDYSRFSNIFQDHIATFVVNQSIQIHGSSLQQTLLQQLCEDYNELEKPDYMIGTVYGRGEIKKDKGKWDIDIAIYLPPWTLQYNNWIRQTFLSFAAVPI